MAVVQTITLTLPANRSTWFNTGMRLGPTDSLRIIASGQVRFDTYAGACAFPEGLYPADDNPCDPNHIYSPGDTVGYLVPEDLYIVTNTKPMSLNAVLRDPGVTPPATAESVTDGLLCTRDETFNLPTSGGTKDVWLIFNDFRHYHINTGQFSVTLERINNDTPPPNIVYGPPTGGRTVPDDLWQHYQGQEQYPAWCWYIAPVYGDAEAYTSLDKSLHCPAYTSSNGENEIPSMEYLPYRGVDISAIPAMLKMASKGLDVTVLNFDHDKLKAGYYDGANIELFEVNWKGNLAHRTVVFAGQLGNSDVDDLSATIEVLSWEDLANSPIGDTYTADCRHNFTEFGCRVDSIDSGPEAADWTRPGEVTGVTSDMKFEVTITGSMGGAGYLTHLAEGRITFIDGDNENVRRDVKTGTDLGSGVIDIVLHRPTPHLPAVGDIITLRAGCTKTFESCDFYGNIINRGAQDYIPLRAGVMRRG